MSVEERKSRRGEGRERAGALRRLCFLASVLPLLFSAPALAQPRVVELINADSVSAQTVGEEPVRRLLGNVVLRQDTTTLWADRATQYLARGEVVLEDAVRIVTGRDTLTAHRVTYDSNTKEAVARGDVRIADGETVLLAPSARYLTDAEQSFFQEGGRLLHDGAVLTAPSGSYDARRKLVVLQGPVELRDSTAVLTSESGTYDTEAERAEFAGNVRLRQRGVYVEADSLTHFRETERSVARGRVVLERLGSAEDDPDAPPDSTRRTLLFGARAAHDERARTSRVEGEAGHDPLLVQLRTDSLGVTDTTLVRARRLDAVQRDSLGDAVTEVVAVGAVRMAQPRFAAVADSALFRRTEPDSADAPVLDRLDLYGVARPSVWADEAQIVGDTLVAYAVGEALDRMEVLGRAFAAQLDTTLGRVRQIQGRRMVARFERDSLRLLAVAPNAEAIYFRATDDGLLDGADRLTADSLAFLFRDGDLREIRGVRGIEGIAYGPQIVPEPFRLSNYVYTPEAKPTRALLLPPDGWEAAWLAAHPGTLAPLSIQEALAPPAVPEPPSDGAPPDG